MESSPPSAEKVDGRIDQRQATFERRYRLLELKERREDRALKRQELELSQGRGIRFTAGQATVAGATLALLSAVIGGLIQSIATRDVEAGKNKAQIAIEELKVRGNIDLEKQKQDAAERLDRAKFETTLILKATEASRREDQIRNLKFFLTAGFIRDPDNKIANISEAAYPSSPPPNIEKVRTPADLYAAARGAVGLVTIVALIKLGSSNSEYSPIGVSREQPQVADSIIVIGFPLKQDSVLLSGLVSSLNEGAGKIGLSASLMVGLGGSPVFGKNGDVVAMAVGNRDDHGVAVPINFARPMLASIGLQ